MPERPSPAYAAAGSAAGVTNSAASSTALIPPPPHRVRAQVASASPTSHPPGTSKPAAPCPDSHRVARAESPANDVDVPVPVPSWQSVNQVAVSRTASPKPATTVTMNAAMTYQRSGWSSSSSSRSTRVSGSVSGSVSGTANTVGGW